MPKLLTTRPGTSLLEMTIFMMFLAASSTVVIGLVSHSNEQQSRQQTVSLVDQTGLQLLQMISQRIRSAERVINPAYSATGTILYLQMASNDKNPSIIYVDRGVMYIAESNTIEPLSATGAVNITNFQLTNTSVASDRQSVFISFEASRIIPIPQQPIYSRTFESLVNLFPDDQQQGDDCGCSAPVCSGTGMYTWEYCYLDTCVRAGETIDCS